MTDADLKNAIQAFQMAGVTPLCNFGTLDFTAVVLEGTRSLVAAISDAVENGITEQPLRAALSGVELLIAIATLSEDCRDT